MPILRREFRPRPRPATGIAGLFWLLPLEHQRKRVRELAKARMSPETISTICRMSLSEVTAIIEDRPQ
jgi:hypothetical protein